MSENEIIEVFVTETGESSYSVDIQLKDHKLKGDEPESFGGKNLGPTPYQMLIAALGECTAMTIRWYAIQQNWPLEKVEVEVTHHKEKLSDNNVKTDVFNKNIILHGENLTKEQRKKLIEISAKCPVQRTIEGSPKFSTISNGERDEGFITD